ncbi:MAG: low molecular weight phosphotyrosine protein phosphatase [Victivallales bacterium]|nr:low molecular weight phosphotyrosine protein phosphatase [Victivallales bacterium]
MTLQHPIRILFVCHGNICRSTMAQSVMKWIADQRGLADKLVVDSAATSTEELGNSIHPGTVAKLREMRIPCIPHRARQINLTDIERFDLIIGMDEANVRNIHRMLGNNVAVTRLLDYTDHPRDIADPWYTHNFDETYDDILMGCRALLDYIDIP